MLQEVALKLVKESFGDTYYDKAVECVQALRTEAIRVSVSINLSTAALLEKTLYACAQV